MRTQSAGLPSTAQPQRRSPSAAPSLMPAVAGQHPRLLFSKADITELKKQAAADPILKKACEDTCSWARRFTLALRKKWEKPFRDHIAAAVKAAAKASGHGM